MAIVSPRSTSAPEPAAGGTLAGLALWLGTAAGCTALLSWLREDLDKAHFALAYLLVVLAASARHGRLVGMVLALACFFAFNFFLLPPFYTLAIANPIDWLVLGAFLTTGAVAAELLARAQRLSAAAEDARALREADELKDALIATVSHDLKTPLTTIKALASELRKEGDERAAIIEEQADRLNRMVADLLDFSRLRAGRYPLRPELQAADDLLAAAVQHFAGRPDAERIHARLPDGEILVGRFDFVQSLRALTNLIQNALDYGPADSAVDVHVHARGARLAFEVSDRGPGVAPHEVERIFEPFYRAAGPRRSGDGAGLGLAIARSLAEAQGGWVAYQPRAGGGSQFVLELPAAALAAGRVHPDALMES